jgi:hypothetical protein
VENVSDRPRELGIDGTGRSYCVNGIDLALCLSEGLRQSLGLPSRLGQQGLGLAHTRLRRQTPIMAQPPGLHLASEEVLQLLGRLVKPVCGPGQCAENGVDRAWQRQARGTHRRVVEIPNAVADFLGELCGLVIAVGVPCVAALHADSQGGAYVWSSRSPFRSAHRARSPAGLLPTSLGPAPRRVNQTRQTKTGSPSNDRSPTPRSLASSPAKSERRPVLRSRADRPPRPTTQRGRNS